MHVKKTLSYNPVSVGIINIRENYKVVIYYDFPETYRVAYSTTSYNDALLIQDFISKEYFIEKVKDCQK